MVIGLAFAGLVVFGVTLSAYAACSNPSPMPAGYASPCPVFSVSPASVSQSQSLTLSATPQAGTDYIYTTAYYAQGSTWTATTLTGNNAAPSYSSGPASGSLPASILSTLPVGTNYIVLWDWLWDSTAQCYKGPGLNQCNTGTWRLQTFGLTQSTSGPMVSISPTTLTFPATQVGMTSAPQTFTVTNVGNADLTILNGNTISGDFNFGGVGTCAGLVIPGASCTYSANFTPTAAGTRSGQEVIYNNAPNSPQTVTLTGTGVSSGVTPTPNPNPTPTPTPTSCTNCNNYYVSTSGSDSNPGTQASPWKTISHAATSLSIGTNGTIVHVQPGTYNECLALGPDASHVGFASRRLVFQSDTKWGAKVQCDGQYIVLIGLGNPAGGYIDFVEFDVTTSGADTCGGIEAYGSYTRIIGNNVHDIPTPQPACSNQGTGMGSSAGGRTYPNDGHDVQFIGNVLDNIGFAACAAGGRQHGTGIYPGTEDNIVENNIVSRICYYPIQFNHLVTRGLIANNVVINNGAGGILVTASDGATADHYTVSNNVMINDGASTSEGCIEEGWGPTGPNSIYLNNAFFACPGGNYKFMNGARTNSGSVQLNSISGVFVNYTGNARTEDYHLAPNSPLIGKGTTGPCASGGISPCTPTTDFSGKTRPNPPSIGAYEQ